MTSWHPTAGVQAARDRAAMMRRIRDYFGVENVLEVDTPSFSNSAASDTQIESFEIPTSLVSRRPVYLHTSPEFCMKRLLCAGFPDIYSICRVFRDGESGRRHQPEFTMVEWYRLGLGLESIIDDALKMIQAALMPLHLSDDPIQFEYRDCFLGRADVDPLTASIDELADAARASGELRQSIGEERDDWLDLILTTRVAPSFEPHRLTVLRHYPANQAAMARLCPNDSRVADRFEVFFGAVELANGYVELVDAEEQSARIERDNEERRRRGRTVRPHDSKLLAALESGLPACAGVAVGFERLQMIFADTEDMSDVITFSFETAP